MHMNESKTNIIVFAPPNIYVSLKFDLGPLPIHGKSMVQKLGVLDESVTFDKQINVVVRSGYFN